MKRSVALSLILGLSMAGTLLAQAPDRRPAGQAPQRRAPEFQELFTVRGVEFTEAQREQAEQLRKKYLPVLVELQNKRGSLFTDQQRRTRREAIIAARQADKQGEELRKAVDAAVKLTDQQKEALAKLDKERAELSTKIQADLRNLLTDEQRRQLRPQGRAGGPRVPPTHGDVKYGPYARNVMDVWLAESDRPTPVLVSIHGGGFRNGNKSVSEGLLRECLKSGISVVAITYRLSDEAIAPAQFLDSARAIQFIRHQAKKWNLDPTRVAATGGSAGAGLSLWLGFHDDLADPDSEDPVLRQSTRLTCMVVYNGQSSYDPRFIRDLFPDTDTYMDSALAQLYDVDLSKLDDLPKEKYKLFEEVSPINHLTNGDPPAMLIYNSKMDTPITSRGIGIHHPKFGKALKKKMDALGIECKVHTGIGRGDPQWETLTMEFVKKHFKMK